MSIVSAWTGAVTLKIAVDRLGAVDDLAGKSGRFTSPSSLDAVHRLRRASDAVLVGVSTVARDNPSLTVRRVPCEGAQPLRVVVDPKGRSPPESTLFTDGERTVVFATDASRFSAGGDECSVERLAEVGPGGLPGLLDTLQHNYGVKHLMVEGGPYTARAFLEKQLVDRVVLVRAPVEFSIPVPSLIDDDLLTAAGLTLHSQRDVEGDATDMWTRGSTPPIWDCLLDGAGICA